MTTANTTTNLAWPSYVPVQASIGSVYTNPSSTVTRLKGWRLHNTNISTETVNVHEVVNSGGSLGTAANSNRVMQITLTAGQTFVWEYPDVLVMDHTNDSIQMGTTTASKVTFTPFGLTNT